MRRHYPSLIVFVVFASAAQPLSADAPAALLEHVMPAGWECLEAPNSLVHPGQVYRRDVKTGVKYPVLDLGPDVQPFSGDVAPIAVNNRERLSASLLVRFLNLAGITAGADRQYSVTIRIFDRSETETYDDPVLIALQKRMTPKKIMAGWSYYVIRAVQQAKRMQMTVDKGIAADLGGEAQFRKFLAMGVGAAKASISGSTGSSYVVDTLRLNKPLTFCYQAQKFDAKLLSAGAGGSGVHIKLLDEYDAP